MIVINGHYATSPAWFAPDPATFPDHLARDVTIDAGLDLTCETAPQPLVFGGEHWLTPEAAIEVAALLVRHAAAVLGVLPEPVDAAELLAAAMAQDLGGRGDDV